MMRKLLVFISCILSLLHIASAQEQLSTRQLANRLFARYEYARCLPLYLSLVNKKYTGVEVIERIADSYRLTNQYEEAEVWYATALNYDAHTIADNYYYAEALLRNQKLTQARKQYEIYFNAINQPAALRLKLAVCDSAEKWMGQPTGFAVKNEHRFNTVYADWGLVSNGLNSFIFTSDRKADDHVSARKADKRTGNSYLNLYTTNGDSIQLLPLDTKGNALFNGDYHAGPMALNASGDTAYITITTIVPAHELPVTRENHERLYTRRLQLIVATKINGQWANFKSFAYNKVKEYSVGHAALSENGQVIYFASDRPGGEGKTDIWYCIKQADGSWSQPLNCGKAINTQEEEAFPTLIGDSLLSFASNGLPGMGGFDLFTAKGQLADWSRPVNLKYPVNSTSDDFYLISPDHLQNGYFASNRQGGLGSDDVYSFNYNAPAESLAAKPQTPPVRPHTTPAIESVLLTAIYYDLDKFTIRPDAAREMDRLIVTLKNHPDMQVQLSSFTDSRASETYNLALSQRRSASALNYLVLHGIAASRLKIESYGEAHLVNQCADNVHCTEAEQQLNRRTEISLFKE